MIRALTGSLLGALALLNTTLPNAAPALLPEPRGPAIVESPYDAGLDGRQAMAADAPDLAWLVRSANRLGSRQNDSATDLTAVPMRLASPLDLARSGRLSSGFGRRDHPVLRTIRFHRGVDIAARSGTPILAAGSGTVTRVGSFAGYGLLVEVDHGGGVRTRYGHANSLLVRAGQRVSRGQLIARVGNTGLATGPHLHFEVWVGTGAVDPLAVR